MLNRATEPISIGSPLDGIDTGVDVMRQPVSTTRRAFNMRPHDPRAKIERRVAVRSGHEKWIESRPCGSNFFQAMVAESIFTSGGTIVGATAFTDEFNRLFIADGQLGDFTGDGNADYDSSSGVCCVGTAMNCASPGSFYKDVSWNAAYSAGNAAAVIGGSYCEDRQNNDTSAGAAGRMSACYFKPTSGGTLPTDNYFIRLTIGVRTTSVVGAEGFIGLFCCGKDSDVVGGTRDKAMLVGVAKTRGVSGGVTPFLNFNDSASVSTPAASYSGFDWHDGITPSIGGSHGPAASFPPSLPSTNWGDGTSHTIEMRKNGKRVEFLVDGATFCVWEDITKRADTGGNTPVVTANTQFGFVLFNVYSAGGTGPAFSFIDRVEVGTVSLQAPTSGVKVAVVVGGDVCTGTKTGGFMVASGGSAAYLPAKTVRMAPGLGGATPYAYIVDGFSYKRLDLNLGVLSAWTPTAGDFLQGSTDPAKKANSIVRHRQRLYQYRLPTDPFNFKCCRYGDANDWDDVPVTSDGYEAVSGDNSDIGLPPFAITCMAPFNADNLIVGGEKALAIMPGDPAQDGVFDDLTDKTGICGDLAYARDQRGNLFIMGYGGVWMLPRGTRELINLTDGKIGGGPSTRRMRAWLNSIDFSVTRVILAWDSQDQGLRVLLHKLDGTPSDVPCAYWDQRTDSWWLDTVPDGLTATAACDISDSDGSEYLLLGCADGYLRRRNDSALMDDGRTIAAELWLPTLAVGPNRRCVLRAVAATLGREGDEAAYGVVGADQPDLLLSTTPTATGLWRGTRQNQIRPEVGGQAVAVRLSTPEDRLFDPSVFSVLDCKAEMRDAGISPMGGLA